MPVMDDSLVLEEVTLSPCSACVHWEFDTLRCAAFSEEDIPDQIWTGGNPHTEPFKGDNGIQFEELTDAV